MLKTYWTDWCKFRRFLSKLGLECRDLYLPYHKQFTKTHESFKKRKNARNADFTCSK